MENSEKQLAIIEVFATGIFRLTYALYVTDKRMAFIHCKPSKTVTGAYFVGGIAGALVAAAIEESKAKKRISPAIDELLLKDKKNFAILYENIEKIQLTERLLSCQLNIKLNDSQKEFRVDNTPFYHLCSLVQGIDLLKGKFIIRTGRQGKTIQ